MLVFVPDKRSPLTGGHGGVRVQPQRLCTTEQKQWARCGGAENNELGGRIEREGKRTACKTERWKWRDMTGINERVREGRMVWRGK